MKNKEKSFKTASEIVHILAMICRIMLIISAIFCVVAAIIFVIVQPQINFQELFAELQTSLAEEGVSLSGNAGLNGFLGLSKIAQVGIITSILLVMAAAILAVSVVFDYVAKLFKNFQTQKTPFIPENVTILRKIAYWMFGILGAGCVASILVGILSGFKFELTINFDSLMLAFVALGLTYIFEYGCKLEEKKKKQ